jgi:hypothetical protein
VCLDLLSAFVDVSICNGVVAHPHLPLLASYGIDDEVKLWQFETAADIAEGGDPRDAAVLVRGTTSGTSVAPFTAIQTQVSPQRSPFWYADRKHTALQYMPYHLELALSNVKHI